MDISSKPDVIRHQVLYEAEMEYFIYIGAVLAVLGLVGLAISIKMAFDLKKNNPEKQAAKDRMGLLIAINTASLGLSFIGLALVVVGMLL